MKKLDKDFMYILIEIILFVLLVGSLFGIRLSNLRANALEQELFISTWELAYSKYRGGRQFDRSEQCINDLEAHWIPHSY